MADQSRHIGPQHAPWLVLLGSGLVAAALLYVVPVTEGDFFWHVASGRWILEHGRLPEADPFCFTTHLQELSAAEAARVRFILSQYWLGQLLLYGIWQSAGAGGIAALRVAVYLGSLVLLARASWKKASPAWTVVAALAAAHLLASYTNERPQIFTFALAPLALVLLEEIRTAGPRRLWALWTLPAVLLLWANMHGGFLVGLALIAAYGADWLWRARRAGVRRDLPAAVSMALAAAASAVNPNGWAALGQALAVTGEYSSRNVEYLTPWEAVSLGMWLPGYWILLALALGALLVGRRRVPPAHVLAILGLGALSLTGLRYLAFLALAFPIYTQHLPRLPASPLVRWLAVAAASLGLGSLYWTADWSRAGQVGVHGEFPEAGARFLVEHVPPGRVFNNYAWGGYLMIAAPEHPVFIDGRVLVQSSIPLYSALLAGQGWRDPLDQLEIQAAILPGTNAYNGAAYPIVEFMARSDAWSLVHADPVALVFVRGDAASLGLSALPTRRVYEHQVARASQLLPPAMAPRPDAYLTRAVALHRLGRTDLAREDYRHALQLDPDNALAAHGLRTLEATQPQR